MTLVLLPLALVSPLLTLVASFGISDFRNRPVQLSMFSGVCFAVTFYGLRQDENSDIFRHMSLIDNYVGLDLFHSFGAGNYNMLFAWDVWNWLIAKTGDPYLLQSSAAFIGYAIIVYIPVDYSRWIGASQVSTVVAVIAAVCFIPTLPLVAGIRSTIAALLCALGAYLYSVGKRGLLASFCLMAIGTMIHPIAIIGLGLFILASITVKRPVVGATIAFVLAYTIGITSRHFLPFLSGSGPIMGDLLTSSIESLLGYQEGDAWTEAHSSSLNTRVNLFVSMLAVSMILGAFYQNYLNRGRLPEAQPHRRVCVVSYFAVILAVYSFGLLLVLPVNGTRLLPAVFSLGSVILIDTMELLHRRSLSYRIFFSVSLAVVGGSALLLHIYSILYSSTDSLLLLLSLVSGIGGLALQ